MSTKTRRRLLVGAGLLLTPMLAFAQTGPQEIPPLVFVFAAMGMLFVLGVVGVTLHFTTRSDRERLGLIERLIDKGQRVPPELFVRINDLPLEVKRQKDFRRGVTLLCWGLGVGLTLYFAYGLQPRAAAWGLIFLFLSGANFLNWYLSGKVLFNRESSRGA